MPPSAKKPAASAAKHKRMHSDVPDEAEDILEHYSHEQLKALVVKLFGDPVTGPIVWRELSSLDEQIDGIPDGLLQEVRLAAKSECKRIMREARDTASALAEQAESLGSKSTVTLGDWLQALKEHLLDIKALMEQGTMVYGPALAWTAVLSVAKSTIYEWDRGLAKVEGAENECDWFHEDVDDLMLDILVAQKDTEHQQNTDPEWVDGGSYDEIDRLRRQAKGIHGPCTYRYPRTMHFIEEGEIVPVFQRVRKQLASKAARKSAPSGVKMAGEIMMGASVGTRRNGRVAVDDCRGVLSC